VDQCFVCCNDLIRSWLKRGLGDKAKGVWSDPIDVLTLRRGLPVIALMTASDDCFLSGSNDSSIFSLLLASSSLNPHGPAVSGEADKKIIEAKKQADKKLIDDCFR
jgi:hypothetical protein